MKLLLASLVLVLLVVPSSAGWRRRRRAPVCNDVLRVVPKHEWKCTPAKKRHVWKDVTKWHTTKQNVTKWTNATRNVTRTETVEYTLPLEDFVGLAKQQISQEILASFEAGVAPDQNQNFDATCTETGEQVAHVLWGPREAGKSTLICQCRKSSDDPCPEVGDGSGESVTNQVSAWDSILAIMVDTIGLGDSLLRYFKEEIGKLVAAGIGRISAVDVKRESFANDALQLRDTLLNLFKVFGQKVRGSIVVVATKPNMKPGEPGVKRLNLILEVMAEQGLRELVIWNGPERDQKSVDDLKAAVSSVPISELDDFWEREEVEVNYTEPEKFEEEYEGEDCRFHEISETFKAKQSGTGPRALWDSRSYGRWSFYHYSYWTGGTWCTCATCANIGSASSPMILSGARCWIFTSGLNLTLKLRS
eukprot:s766_g11.t1